MVWVKRDPKSHLVPPPAMRGHLPLDTVCVNLHVAHKRDLDKTTESCMVLSTYKKSVNEFINQFIKCNHYSIDRGLLSPPFESAGKGFKATSVLSCKEEEFPLIF